jgi:glycosyltransferase involved in cell wall biosynthesis
VDKIGLNGDAGNLKIAIISWWFAGKMGYSENLLPAALARLGHEVHVISSDLQPDFPNYKEAYEPFIGPQVQPCGTTKINGFSLHRLPHRRTRYGIAIKGLIPEIKGLNPDVIQCFGIPQMSTYQTAFASKLFRIPLFLEEHTHISTLPKTLTFPQKIDNWLVKNIFGPSVCSVAKHCYPIAKDVEELTINAFGCPAEKVTIQSLGVDTTGFYPVKTSEDEKSRLRIRNALNFSSDDVVFVYTGRFSADKAPIVLAQAVAFLRDSGYPVRGLFIGGGSTSENLQISACNGCDVLPFVHSSELPSYYRAADVGVWPKQESTSQLDALATGLPIIISDRVQALERTDGCGLTYIEEDVQDLQAKMVQLLDGGIRSQLGMVGAKRVAESFSWDHIARFREAAYINVIK